MRQRLIKAIACIALVVSVFFCTSVPAMASQSRELVPLFGYLFAGERITIEYDPDEGFGTDTFEANIISNYQEADSYVFIINGTEYDVAFDNSNVSDGFLVLYNEDFELTYYFDDPSWIDLFYWGTSDFNGTFGVYAVFESDSGGGSGGSDTTDFPANGSEFVTYESGADGVANSGYILGDGVYKDDGFGVGHGFVSSYTKITLSGGYVYSGSISYLCTLDYTYQDFVQEVLMNRVDYASSCSVSGVGVGIRKVAKNKFYVDLTFNGFYALSDIEITTSLTVMVDFVARVDTTKQYYADYGSLELTPSDDFVSKHFVCTLPTLYNEGGILTEQGYLDREQQAQISQQEMAQQQQIANQQSQQSQQQHNSLINGYDNEANDSMLADKNSVLQGFEQQQDQAMSNGQQYVADFSANYDTAPLQAMAPAFMMISTWFNDLWGGMGNFSTVLFVGLMLCVAGYILKLKH